MMVQMDFVKIRTIYVKWIHQTIPMQSQTRYPLFRSTNVYIDSTNNRQFNRKDRLRVSRTKIGAVETQSCSWN